MQSRPVPPSPFAFCLLQNPSSFALPSVASMGVLHGEKIYNVARIAGSLGFITFGWDAGVLGGILLTPEFQSAMGVSPSCLAAHEPKADGSTV